MSLIARGEDADLPCFERVDLEHRRLAHREHRAFVDLIGRPELELGALRDLAGHHAHEHDDAAIGVVPAVEDQCGERSLAIGHGRWDAVDDGLEHIVDALPGLRRYEQRVFRVEPDRVLDLLLDPIGSRDRQIDLVEHRHDVEVVVERDVDVRERLRFDALRGIDDEQRAFARRQ